MVDGRFAVVPGSFFRQRPSEYTIQLLEPSIVHSISYDDLQQLYSTSVLVNQIARQVLEESAIELDWRIKLLRIKNVNRRYELFAQHFGTNMNRLPLMYVASFLNITQSTISRIRKRRKVRT